MTRAFVSGVRIHFLLLSRSSFDLVAIFVWPLIFATIAYYLYGVHADPNLLVSATLGASMMAIWSSVVIGASGALEMQRWSGTLELLVAAPVPLFVALAPITTATSVVGVYSLGATVLWGHLAFGISLHYAHPLLFVASFVITLVALSMLGLVVASTFVLYRAAVFLGFALQNPVYLATGLLIPLTLLPGWVTPISWLLAPTWAMRALRGAAIGGGNVSHDLGLCVVTGGAYLAISFVTLHVFENLARQRATLPLA